MNSKDLRNLAEAYQNIQEEPRPARRRTPNKTVEQIKAEIDAKNPTKTGPVTGQRVPGVQQSRPATRIPNATGGAVTGSLRSGNLSFPGDRSGAYAAAKQSLSAPPAATLSRGASLVRNLKGLVKGPLVVGAEMGANALLEPLAKKTGEEIAKASLRGIASATGKTDKARAAVPSLYGAKGPDLTPDIVQGVKSREPRGMSNIPPAEGMVNNPDYGKPGSVSSTPKLEAPKPPTAQERAYGARSKLTADQQALNRQYDIDRGLKDGRVTKPTSSALDKYLAKRKK